MIHLGGVVSNHQCLAALHDEGTDPWNKPADKSLRCKNKQVAGALVKQGLPDVVYYY